jgi:hypothetical protein
MKPTCISVAFVNKCRSAYIIIMRNTHTNNPALDRLDSARRNAETLICDLALQFDCLRHKSSYFQPGHFDADLLAKDSGPWSSGQIHCVNFLLAVWSGNDWPGREFRLIDAMGALSADNLEPIINWMNSPVWP